MICPICKTENTDDWPLTVGDHVEPGGCQDCWEKEVDASWWKRVIFIEEVNYEMSRVQVNE